ncbi:MAG: hypothetical protein JWQ49_5250 [Edaphobacter sp.]|nr:hypothetical protein [Edaphobacter sp.]
MSETPSGALQLVVGRIFKTSQPTEHFCCGTSGSGPCVPAYRIYSGDAHPEQDPCRKEFLQQFFDGRMSDFGVVRDDTPYLMSEPATTLKHSVALNCKQVSTTTGWVPQKVMQRTHSKRK